MGEVKQDLFGDYKRADRAQTNQSGIEYNIQLFNASTDQVRSWYFAQDPLAEVDVLLAARSLATGNNHHWRNYEGSREFKSIAYEKGSAILVSNSVFPELYTEGPFQGYLNLEKKFMAEVPSESIVNPNALLSVDDIIGFSLGRLKRDPSIQLSDDSLSDLFLAGEMSLMAAMIGKVKPPSPHLPITSHKLNEYAAVMLFGEVARRARESSNLQTKLLGLKAQMAEMAMALLYIRTKPEAYKMDDYEKGKKFILKDFLDNLENVYLGDKSIDLGKDEIRGSLHEALWFLDFTMLLMHEDKDEKLFLFPSKSFEDFPRTGLPRSDRPRANRAFDFSLRELNQGVLFFQLKSRPNPHGKTTYHPAISVVKERNFQDVNPGRLTAKLRRYREYIETGNEELWSTISDKYILESVKDVWKQVSQVPHLPHQLDTMKSAYLETQSVPKNKSAKRRLMKNLRAQGLIER